METNRIAYIEKNFSSKSFDIINQANTIIDEYEKQGYNLTLRQLYYQFVARDLIPNNVNEYKRLGSIINDGRLAGVISWLSIVDRTRNLRSLAHWDHPSDIIQSASAQFRFDKWNDQEYRIEVWIEKDALIGIISGVCNEYDIPFFSCRGYVSQSEMWNAAQRLIEHRDQRNILIHLGDHDPSGIDMTRDIKDRLALFEADVDVHRIALNMDQIDELNPPPNPAKLSDSRSKSYINKFGNNSWELDALEPSYITEMIKRWILGYINQGLWDDSVEKENMVKSQLVKISENWDEITTDL